MKFGIREIADVVFKAKADVKIGTKVFKKGQPVLYIDSAKTAQVEGAATTVYATGGRGNTRLVTWEGEKTLTFTVEDALLSPIGMAVLTGAGLLGGPGNAETPTERHVHATTMAVADENGIIDLTDVLGGAQGADKICADAPIFVMEMDGGDLTGVMLEGFVVDEDGKKMTAVDHKGKTVFVDYYIIKPSAKVYELQIDAENFAGYYYVEASTLFRRQADGVDMPAELTFPNVKIQSNFTFAMASTGDPSTFSFVMDAMPGYTIFEPTKKVLCAIQIIDDSVDVDAAGKTVFPHAVANMEDMDAFEDSVL